jgi:RNA polymerase sigma factor (sigma-70 family)
MGGQVSVAQRKLARMEAAADGELLAQVALGDSAALGTLYDRYAPSLTRYAARIDRADAEDVVQTVFMRVLRLASRYRTSSPSARPWLFAITARVLQERARSLARMGRALFRMREHTAQSTLSHGDAQHDLERGVARMSRAKSTVLLLHEVEGFSCDEIAKMLSIPVGTVWTRLHHARQELRTFYQGDEA